MSTRSVVILLVVALSLAGMVLLFEREVSREVEPSADEYKIFKEYRSEEAHKVSLIYGDMAVQLMRDVEGWQMTSPEVAVADTQRVEELLGRVGDLMEVAQPIKAKPGQQVNMAEYGLDDSSRRIIVSYGGVAEAALTLGSRVANADRLYARLGNENRVMIIDAGASKLLEEVRQDGNYYRSRRVFQAKHIDKALQIQVLGVSGANSKPVVLQKDEKMGLWSVAAPLIDRADQEAVTDMLGKLAELQVAEFLPFPRTEQELQELLVKAGLSGQVEPEVVELAAEDQQTVALALGRIDEQGKLRYALVARQALLVPSQEIVKLPADCVDVLPQSLGSLRDKKFLRFGEGAVSRVRLRGSEGLTVLARSEVKEDSIEESADSEQPATGSWMIAGPREAPAEQGVVDEFLRAVQDLAATSVVGTAKDEMGFAEPYLTLEIKVENGPGGTLEVGAATDDGKSRYARLKGDKYVRKVPAETVEQLAHGYLHFRQREIAKIGSWDIKRFSISLGETRRQGEYRQGQWWLTEPTVVRAEDGVVRDTLGIFDPLKAEEIVADDVADGDAEALERYGLLEPALRVTVAKEVKKPEGADEEEAGEADEVEAAEIPKIEEYVLLIGKAVEEDLSDEVYARLGGEELVFTLDKMAVGKLTDDLRSRRVLPIANWQVKQLKEVQIVQGSEVLKLVKDGEDWQVVSPKEFPPEQEAVEAMLGTLGDFESSEFGEDPADKKYGLANPAMTVSVTLAGAGAEEAKTYRCFVGKQVLGKSYAVKAEDEQVVRLVEPAKLEKLQQSYLTYRKKQILSLKQKGIRSIEIIEKGKQSQKAQLQDAGWRLSEPADGVLDLMKVEEIAKSISNVQAAKLVAEGPEAAGEYGLDRPTWTVTVELTDEWGQIASHRLLIGSEFKEVGSKLEKGIPRPRYARLDDGETVFVLSSKDVHTIEKGLVFRPGEDD